MNVGVLALQGDVPEHFRALRRVVPEQHIVWVRRPEDLVGLDALFLPGGESTTIADLLARTGLWVPMRERIEGGLAVLATCAGLIVLARALEPSPGGRDPPTFALLDIRVRRNDYGRQRESFEGPVRVQALEGPPFPGVFIRAPRILSVGPAARAIAWREAEVVGVRQGSVWGFTFHPELTRDPRLHRAFLRSAASSSS
jgi:5'-phosphate synthase pdxT subunit